MNAEHLSTQHGADMITAAGKATPALAVSGATMAGVSLDTWVMGATLLYLVLQIAYLIWKFFRERSGQVKADG